MRKEMSFTAPTAQEPKCQCFRKMTCDGLPSLSIPYMSTLLRCVVRKDIQSANESQKRLEEDGSPDLQSQTDRRYLRMAFVMHFRVTTPSLVREFVHCSLSMIPLVLQCPFREP